MRLLVAEQRVVVDGPGEELEIEGGSFGPLQMLAASLALCTAAVLHEYGATARLHLHGLRVEVDWDYADDPYRVEQFAVTLRIPETVPAARHAALVRAADTCTVHNTLTHPPRMSTRVAPLAPAATAGEDHVHHE